MDAAAIAFTTIKPIGQWCKPLYVMMLLNSNYWLLSWLCVGYMKGDTKKLSPVVAYHQKLLDKFLKSFWDYYRKLLAYQNAPNRTETAVWILHFRHPKWLWGVRWTKTTAAKMEELLLVLEHPELPLHNNPAELGLGQSCCDVYIMVLKRRMVLRLGILLCPLLLRLVSWELVFLNTCATASLELKI